MLRLHAGIDGDMGQLAVKFLVGHGAQLRAGDGLHAVGQDTQLPGDGHGGIDMVAGDHDGADARLAALINGGLYLRTDGIDHAGKAQKAQVMLQIRGLAGRGHDIIGALGGSQHAKGTVGHGLVGGQNLGALFLGHRTRRGAVPIGGAMLQHHIGAALGKLEEAAFRAVDGGHHLAAGIKGGLAHAGKLFLKLALGQAALGAPRHQRGFGGLAGHAAVGVQRGIGTQGHGRGGAVTLRAVVLHHGHFVLGQGTGFIRADDLGAAQRLHSGQAADDGISFGHIGNADAEHHRHHGGKALGNGGHRQRHGDHEGVEDHIRRERTGAQQLHAEDQHADHQHQLGEDAGKLGQLALKRRLPLLRVGQRIGDLAHLGVHTGMGDHHTATAIDHSGAHIDHVAAVTQRDILRLCPQVQKIHQLGDRDRLAGEGGLLHLHAGALQHAAVRRDGVARLQQHDITYCQILAANGNLFPVTQHLAGGGGHLLQRLDGFFRLALLKDAQHGIDHDHEEDHDHIGKAFVLHHGQHGADDGGRQQDQGHGIGHLLEKALDERILLSLGQLVFPVFRKAALRLGPRQSAGVGVKRRQHGFRALQIILHDDNSSY